MIAHIRKVIAIIFGIISAILTFPFALISPFNPNVAKLFTRLNSFFAYKILGISLEKKNFNLIDKEQAGIIISNHQDTIDIWCLPAHIINKPIFYVGKKSLFWIPFLGPIFYLTGNLFIDRRNKKEALKTLERAKKIIRKYQGFIWIMPEGTRTLDKGMQQFKKGAFYLAKDLKLPIIPIVVSSYYKNINFNEFKEQKVILQMLKPVSTKDWTLENMDEKMEQIRQNMLIIQGKLDQSIG